MAARHRALAVALLVSLLTIACGSTEPMATSAPPTATPTLLPTRLAPTETPPPSAAKTGPAPTAEHPLKDVQVTFVYNAGFLITAGDKKILIDVLYEGYPQGILKPVVDAQPPFDGVDLILATHEHEDHFSPELVARAMSQSPEAVFVSSQKAVDWLLAADDGLRDRAIPIQLRAGGSEQLDVNGILLEVLYISHGEPELLNLGFVITVGDARFFHTGDSTPDDVTVSYLQSYGLPAKQLDVAFVPYFFLSQQEYHAYALEGIQARYFVPMHYDYQPPSGIEADFPNAVVFQESLESWVLPLDAKAAPRITVQTPAPELPIAQEDVTRTALTYDELMNGLSTNSPVDDEALAMPGDAASSDYTFEGRLELFGEDARGDIEMVRGELEPEAAHLPEFDYAFVQSGSYLVPTQRGQIIAEHPNWNYIIGPGRVWQENGDQGYSRASFPFALVWKGSNATFNGTMTFLFDDASVSKVWYQITQETTTYTRANFWGLLEAAYHRGPVPNAAQIRADFDQELADRFPTRPIEQLAKDYPGIDVSAFGRGVSPEHRTMYGFVINGVNYVGECRTRFGQYAYCDWMRATSYSTAKSAFVSVALMRLAQKYGPEVTDLLIKDYVPESAESPGDWEGVTFNNTIDMATGNYESAGYMADEDGEKMGGYWDAQPYADRISAAFDWPHSAKPGKKWVYRTSDTFILTRALHNYLQSQEGADADIFEFVVKEVYKPIKVGPGAHTTMRTADEGWQGQPEGGYGLWWIQDDIAKIATLLHNGGRLDDEQLLHPDLLRAAMQQDPNDRGVDIDRSRKYNNAFWAQSYDQADGFDCEFWVPQMLGVSGNVIALMPNGSTYYYFSDNQQFTWDAAIRESDKIAPHCP